MSSSSLQLSSSSPTLSDTVTNTDSITATTRGSPDGVVGAVAEGYSLFLWRFERADAFSPVLLRSYPLPSLSSFLDRFVEDGPRFRTFIRQHSIVLSGSAVLSYFNPAVKPNDLDAYTKRSEWNIVVWKMMAEFGATLVRCSRRYLHNGICQVARLETTRAAIDIICSINDSASYPIAWFWGSPVQNAITADSFSVAYPWLTLQNLGVYCEAPSTAPDDIVEKYEKHGYQLAYHPSSFDAVFHHAVDRCLFTAHLCLHERRFLGDGGCLNGRFLNDGAAELLPPGEQIELEHSTGIWALQTIGCGGSCANGTGREVALLVR